MRKITKESVNAFNENRPFKKANTEIEILNNKTLFYLYDNLIAIKENDVLKITNCGYFTNVTKERLNGLKGVNIYQQKFKWYLNGTLWNGELTTI
jgi:hypothetical protein